MKLLSCHIENFGTLSNFDLNFQDGLTVIKEDNGFGKTTLAAFLKAAFYGLTATAKKGINDNERIKYTPWQGGIYGGSVDFSANGKNYRIERYFGSKAKGDTFKLFNLSNGKESADYSENIGAELFQIDADSFERSCFIPQNTTTAEMTVSLNAKLTGLIENSDDLGNFDSAMAILERKKGYFRKKNGAGRIADLEKEILKLKSQIADAKIEADSLKAVEQKVSKLKNERKELTRSLDKVRKDLKTISDAETFTLQNERRKDLELRLQSANDTIEKIRAKYKNGVPNETNISSAFGLADSLHSLEHKIETLSQDTAEKRSFNSAIEFFGGNIPKFSEIENCKNALKTAEKSLVSAETLKRQLNHGGDTKKSNTPLKISVAITGILAIIGSALMLKSLVLGGTFLGVGLVFTAIFTVFLLRSRSAKDLQKSSISAQCEEFETIAKNEIAKAKAFTLKYSDDSPETVIETISANYRDYEMFKNSVNATSENLKDAKEKLDATKETLQDFLLDTLGEIPFDIRSSLQNMHDDQREFARCGDLISTLKSQLDNTPIPLSNISLTVTDSKETLEAKETDLVTKIDTFSFEIASLEQRINMMLGVDDRLYDLEIDLQTAIQEKADCDRNLLILESTISMLTLARENLSGKYLVNLKESFMRYTEEISSGIGEFLVDGNLQIMLDRGGLKEKDYFSTGYKDMLDICMRLALIDALYEGEKPPLILDDPFVNLDDERLENSLKLLNTLSRHGQIIYLTCHKSRVP